MPETPSANKQSIPVGSSGVKRGLSQDLAELPVKNGDVSLTLLVGITGAQMDAVGELLVSYQRRAIIETNFKLGDLWNQSMLPENKIARREWLRAVKARLNNDAAYERFESHMHRCGWVAGKWHPMRRELKGTWTHYVTHKPCDKGAAVKSERKELELTPVSSEIVDGVLVEHWLSPNKTPFFTRKSEAKNGT